MIHSDVLSFDSCVAMSDAKKHLKKACADGKCQHMDTGIWESGESGTVSSQMLEGWFRDYFTGMWSGNKITAYEYSGNQIGNPESNRRKKLKSESKTVNYEMTMKKYEKRKSS